MTDPRDPDFFVVGAPKCGTSALCAWLHSRDDVFMAEPKELFHWNRDWPGQQAIHGVETPERYRRFFRRVDRARHRRVGEGSTHYLLSDVAIPLIAEALPQARIIAMLRNPVELAHAYHAELVFNFQEDVTDFEAAWRLQPARAEGRRIPASCPSPHNLQYRDFATFAPQLRRLFAHVPEERRLVLLHDDLKRDPADVWRRVLGFLELPEDGRSDFGRVYASRLHRFEGLARLYKDPPALLAGPMRGVRRVWHGLVPPQARAGVRGALQKPVERVPLRPVFRAELACGFARDIEETSALLGRDLSHWLGGEPGRTAAA